MRAAVGVGATLALVTGGLLAGCGGDDDGVLPAADADATSTTSTTQQTGADDGGGAEGGVVVDVAAADLQGDARVDALQAYLDVLEQGLRDDDLAVLVDVATVRWIGAQQGAVDDGTQVAPGTGAVVQVAAAHGEQPDARLDLCATGPLPGFTAGTGGQAGPDGGAAVTPLSVRMFLVSGRWLVDHVAVASFECAEE